MVTILLLNIALQSIPVCPAASQQPIWRSLSEANESKRTVDKTDESLAVLRAWAYCEPDSFSSQANDDEKHEAIDWWVQWMMSQGRRKVAALHARALSRLTEDEDQHVRAHAKHAWSIVTKRY